MDLVLRAARVITADGERRADVGVVDGRITAVADHLDGDTVVELRDDEVLLPGLVDTHVHVNDPGRSDWEGFDSATRAAAAGGVTTIIDMPLNSLPPTTTVASLKVKQESARDRVHVDVGFWGGIVPTNLEDLEDLHDAGVFGFKCFLIHSGVDEFPHVSEGELRAALERLQPRGALTVVHAEDPHDVTDSGPGYRSFLDSRPHVAEAHAITTVVDLAIETKARLHVLHLSSEQGLQHVKTARDLGLAVTAETCPHYLTFVAEEIGDAATEFKCCPPIRDAANRESLWRALKDDLVTLVVTDHSPCTPDLKQGDFATAWGGIASLQLGLPAVWTQARQRGHALTDVVRWMATNPADLVGLRAKGRIAPGADADFCVFAPDEAFVVDRAKLHHRNPVTPYHGRPLAGVVRQTWLRGQVIEGRPRGRLLTDRRRSRL